jgi:hypothetical protein
MKSHQKNTFSAPADRKSDGSQSNSKDGAQPPSSNTNTQRNQVPHTGSNQRRAAKKSSITTPRKDDNTRVSKPKREYPQVFPSYEKAQKGVPPAMIRERRDAGLCTRCGKKNHDAKFCAGRANTTVAVAPPWKANPGQAGVGSVSLAAKASKPLAARITRPRTQEIGDLDSDMN